MPNQTNLINIDSLKIFEKSSLDKLPEVTSEARQLAPVQTIIKRDKKSAGDADGRKKYRARQELSFVYMYLNINYRSGWSEADRIKRIKQDLGLPDKWKIDNAVQDFIDLCVDASDSVAYRGLRTTTETINNAMDALETIRNVMKQKQEVLGDAQIDITTVLNEEASVTIAAQTNELFGYFEQILKYSKVLPGAIQSLEKFKKDLGTDKDTKLRGSTRVNRYNR